MYNYNVSAKVIYRKLTRGKQVLRLFATRPRTKCPFTAVQICKHIYKIDIRRFTGIWYDLITKACHMTAVRHNP